MAKQPVVDIDAILAVNQKGRPGTKCMVGLALGRMDDDTVRDKVVVALADRERFSADGLAAVFKQLGFDMSRAPIERHRAGRCLCPR